MPPPPSPGKCESCYTLGRSLLLSKNAGGLLRYFAPSPWKLHSLLKVTMTGKKTATQASFGGGWCEPKYSSKVWDL